MANSELSVQRVMLLRWLGALALPLSIALPPLCLAAWVFLWELFDFARTGECHGEPPDIPSHVCSGAEFLDHFTQGWDLIGYVVLSLGWLPVGLCIGVALTLSLRPRVWG
ncbi:MAG: hypothetical protein AB7K71_15165 [Polyangiaceae bacterium]